MAAAASDFRSPHHTHPLYPAQASGAPLLLCTSHFLPQCESPYSQALAARPLLLGTPTLCTAQSQGLGEKKRKTQRPGL